MQPPATEARPTKAAPAAPEPAPAPLPLAGWWPRAGAYVIDTVILGCIAVVVFFVVWATSGKAGTAGIAAAIAWGFTDLLIRGLVYAPLLMRRHGPRNGQTLGKQLAGIRVVCEDARPIGYREAFVREWLARTLLIEVCGVALTGSIAVVLDYMWPWWDERNRALHDLVASTMVFRTDGRVGRPRGGALSG
jgi:uncharacterized RDD family membrane protein YckC